MVGLLAFLSSAHKANLIDMVGEGLDFCLSCTYMVIRMHSCQILLFANSKTTSGEVEIYPKEVHGRKTRYF